MSEFFSSFKEIGDELVDYGYQIQKTEENEDEYTALTRRIQDMTPEQRQHCMLVNIAKSLRDMAHIMRNDNADREADITVSWWKKRREPKHGPMPTTLELWLSYQRRTCSERVRDNPGDYTDGIRLPHYGTPERAEYDKWMRRKPRKAAK